MPSFEKINVNNLSPYQLAIQAAVGKGKNAHLKLTPELLGQIADQVFGPAPITPGSQITFQSGDRVEWTDPQGYRHVATRNLDGQDPAAGQWRDNTDRPKILPQAGQQEAIKALFDRFTAMAQNTAGTSLAQLDPQTAAALQAISDAEVARNQQQFEQSQGSLLANLYGNRINQSSIANSAVGQLLQLQGLVSQQQQADAASRQLGVQQFLTSQGTEQNRDLLNLLQSLTGQGTQRDIATGQLGLGFEELAERARQANRQFELAQQQADLELAKARAGSGPLSAGLGLAGSLATSLLGGGGGSLLKSLGIGGGGGSGAIYGAGSAWPQN